MATLLLTGRDERTYHAYLLFIEFDSAKVQTFSRITSNHFWTLTRIDDKNVLLLAVEIDVAKVVFNEYNLKDVVVAIAQKYMVVA